ncbi:hypothetical protein DQX05_12095 [Paenibacillus thiaminolyticus]|uniref:Plasmid replication protein RepL domain-containing protein n=2 Tax=Paenibacillus thiaminolyticus TaxID=49283 RepID=A0A3A3GHZ6_PANTH|nr:hypothetical protein DQX05_12095 [Paenibacillus thiaminolyticus]
MIILKIFVSDERGNVIAEWGSLGPMLELLGGKKIKVVNYFLKCAEENDGYIFGSLRKISEDTGVAYSTVVETVKNFRIPD